MLLPKNMFLLKFSRLYGSMPAILYNSSHYSKSLTTAAKDSRSLLVKVYIMRFHDVMIHNMRESYHEQPLCSDKLVDPVLPIQLRTLDI